VPRQFRRSYIASILSVFISFSPSLEPLHETRRSDYLTDLVLLLPDLGNTSGVGALFSMLVVSEIGREGSTSTAGAGAGAMSGTGISGMSTGEDGDITGWFACFDSITQFPVFRWDIGTESPR